MTEEKIGYREFLAISLIAVAPKLADDTPSHFFEEVGTAGWIVPLIAGIIAFIPIIILMWIVKQYEDANIIEIIYDLFGQYIGGGFIFLLWLAASVFMIYDSAVHSELIETMYFTNSSGLVIYLILVACCAFGAFKGIGAIGSVAWITLPFLILSLNFSFILAIGHGQTSFLYPLMGNGSWQILKTSIKHFGLYADFFFFFVLITLVPNKKIFKKVIWLSFGLVIFALTASMVTFLMVFDFESIHLVSYPYHELIRFISIGFLTNIEALYFPYWLMATFIRYSLYFYLCVYVLGKLLRIKDYRFLIPIYALLFVLIGSIPDYPSFELTKIKGYNTHIFSVIFMLSPILIWLRLIYVRRKRSCSEST